MKGWAKVGAVCFGLLCAIPSGAAEPIAQKKTKVRKLAQPGYIPLELRPLLQQRMANHGQDLVELMLAVTLLQRDVVKDAAEHIAREPRLARPTAGGEAELNAALPERFFVLQDELRSRAQAVAVAATKPDNAALGAAFSRLTETCVACHTTYLEGPPGR